MDPKHFARLSEISFFLAKYIWKAPVIFRIFAGAKNANGCQLHCSISINSTLFHRLGGAIKRGCVEIFSFIFPPCYMASKNINIFTGYVVSRKNIDIFTGVANTP